MDFKQQLDDYRSGRMSAAERAAFEALLHDSAHEQQLNQLLDAGWKEVSPIEADTTQEFIYARIKEQYISIEEPKPAQKDEQPPVYRFIQMRWIRYAAAVILLVTSAALWYAQSGSSRNAALTVNTIATKDIEPGHDGAVLTLANGKKVVLDSMHNTVIAQQNGTDVILKDGQLSYEHSDANSDADNSTISYNTMTTPRGRQFQLLLPDGTKVWLNAASSITYPTRFTQKERKVEIQGEAYFEVAQNVKAPFRVAAGRNSLVEALGTSFNIHAYNDEISIRTTLLNGAVKVNTGTQYQLLKPGQQAIQNAQDVLSVTNAVNTQQVMAWKNGLFNFDGYDLKAVMREIGRWYDLDIVYEAEPTQEEMMGEIQRTLKLSQVMKILQRIHIHYRLEGKQLIIMK